MLNIYNEINVSVTLYRISFTCSSWSISYD